MSTNCSVGCITGPNDTPVTANIGTATPIANDACFTGSPPMTLSTNSTTGGNYVTVTGTLAQSHTPYAVVNFQGTNADVPPLCSPPLLLMSGAISVSFVEPTNVVAADENVPLWMLISFNDSNGKSRNVASVTSTLTLRPGGTLPSPPLLSFSVTDGSGNPITSIPGGSNAFARGTISASTPAPVGGLRVTVTTDPPNAFVTDGSFTIYSGCTTNSDWGLLKATSSFASNVSVTLSAVSGSNPPLTQTVTVTPPPLNIQSVTLSPSSVTGGGSATATVTLNRAVLASDASSTISVRVSEGALSGTRIATFPGCAGSPACTGSLTVPIGAQNGSVTITTSGVGVQDFVTIAASAFWANTSASANLTINPGSCTPQTCSSLGFNCGSASDGCGGTLNCGTCTAPQTCGGSGVANVCGTPATPTLASLTLNPTSLTGGSSSTGTATLSAAAPSGGTVVTLSSNSSKATVPSSVAVPGGATSTTFGVTTTSVTATTTAVITGTAGGISKQASLTINPAGAVSLSSLTLNPTSVRGGDDSIGTVKLTAAAPSGGAVVSLSSSNTNVARVPSTVTLSAGSTSKTFTVKTQRPNSNTTVNISATYGSVTKTAALTVSSRH